MIKFAKIIVDVTNSQVDRVFDYLIPENLEVSVGEQVCVPFGGRTIKGIIISISDKSDVEVDKLKSVICKENNDAFISPKLVKLAEMMKDEFFLRMADTLRLFLPSAIRTGKASDKTIAVLSLSPDFNFSQIKKNAQKQIEVAKYLLEKKFENQPTLCKMFSSSAVSALKEKGILLSQNEIVRRSPSTEKIANKNVIHTQEQSRAINAVDLSSNGTYLLHGVTGSGKTEVYMTLIEKVLRSGKTAIMLVPEISLTPQVALNFKSRFGERIALLHSGLSDGEKNDEWKRMRSGEAKIVVGARSAIFSPLENVGIIVIDEEHDQSYSSESNPRFNTFKVAQMRASLENCPLVLGSATPSCQTYHLTETGEIKLLEMPSRVNKKPLPSVMIVDMLGELKEGASMMFSSTLLRELEKVEKQKKQAMLLLNRRGYSSFFQCKDCGYVAKCENCDVSLVYHKEDETLRCHYCGKKYRALTKCPQCHSSYIKQGAVGTEKIVSELTKLFPNVKILRMDNDTTLTKNAHQKILTEFANTIPCFLVGTQMIAKGHDFPDVTLVGILDADQSLFHSSYLSTERTFQLLTQMTGRAGRSTSEGLALLQTFSPKHYVFKFVANGNYKGFYEKEINIRQTTLFPPFATVVKILVSSLKEQSAKDVVKQIYEKVNELKLNNISQFYYLSVSGSPISRLQNKFRFQVVARISNSKDIIAKMFEIASQAQKPNVSVFAQINPQSMQ